MAVERVMFEEFAGILRVGDFSVDGYASTEVIE